MNTIYKFITLAFLTTCSLQASAVAFLNFSGDFAYDPNTQEISIDAHLYLWDQNLSFTPTDTVADRSSVQINLTQTSNAIIGGDGSISAEFNGSSSVSIINGGGGNETLLEGNLGDSTFSSVTSGLNYSRLDGDMFISGGLLQNDFTNPSDLWVINFNLIGTTTSVDMFDSAFTGSVIGRIESYPQAPAPIIPQAANVIPEPGALSLLAIGLIGVGFSKRKKK